MKSRQAGFTTRWRRLAGPVVVAVLWGAAPAHTATAAEPAARLVYAEPLQATWEGKPGPKSTGDADRGTLHFHALGRDFHVELGPNARLGPPPPDVQVQAGTLAGMPGSWARLTRHGEDVVGLVYDGAEYYGIEPVMNLVTVLDPDVPQPAAGNMVYRLADLLVDPQGLACGLGMDNRVAAGPVTAASAVRRLSAELAAAAATGPSYRVHLAPVADVEFASRFGANAISEILARLNIADGIFSSQVGIDITADAPTVFTSADPPYSLTSTTASTLLDQISDYRLASRTSAGLTHLFTNKTFANRLVGIAWQGAVCFDREGAGLSTSAGITSVTSGLVAAHEIGHNFGAPHDGETGSPCASTPKTYLMAPLNTGSQTFSPCSLDQMAVVISERAGGFPACLTSITDYDVGVVAPVGARVDPGASADLLIQVRNLGNQAASTLNLRLHVPSPLAVTGADTSAGYCDFAANDVSCDLPGLDPDGTWNVLVHVVGDQVGTYSLDASVTAAADGAPDDNARTFTLTVGNPPAATGDGGGGGGGGALDALGLAGLAGVALARRARAARRV